MEQVLKSLEEFERDSIWFSKNYDKLKKKHKGEFVLIKNSKVIMSGKDMDEIVQKADKIKMNLSECLVEFIPIVEMAVII